jgi:hypothetical protein
MNIMTFPSSPGLFFILAPKHVFIVDVLEHHSYALTHEEFVEAVIKVRHGHPPGS